MRALIVDPPAYTPPYDHSLARGLSSVGVDVELVTSHFPHGPVPATDGYAVDEFFYRRSSRRSARARRIGRSLEHVPDMLRFRARARDADVVHYMWLPVPPLDRFLLDRRTPRILTMHWRLPDPASFVGRSYRAVLRGMDHVIIHTSSGRTRLVEEFGVDADRITVIPHGAFDYLTRLDDPVPLPDELAATDRPVVLAFGLIRPYKGTEDLLAAMESIPDAELWIVGMPRMEMTEIRRTVARLGDRVRLIERFVPDPELPAFFERADVVALPYHHIEQSGILYTAMAFGKPLVLTDVGGFPEIADRGAAVLTPPRDPAALATALGEVLGDDRRRADLARAAVDLAAGAYSWERIGAATKDVYRSVSARSRSSAVKAR